ncbi:secreted RxLR effector protein 161-like [Humulus lupulus]|uniref:secreted RxLR effector protein 161-like n=1 Tax=Humulus lupulus TaxID=3486 RepID=UPI002B400656|nr:secreted RxLR effector protein 161-like [Humulus lupulus]
MKDLGTTKKILSMVITRKNKEEKLIISQTGYLSKVLDRFNMSSSKPVSMPIAGHFKFSNDQCPKTNEDTKRMESVPYSEAIGCLMYSMVSTRPNLAYPIGVLSRYMANPGESHWECLKWLLRYIKGTLNYGLHFKKSKGQIQLEGFVDSDYAANRDNRKSVISFIFLLNGNCICWKTQLQPVVALSTIEAEFMAVTEAIKEGI